CARAFGAGVPTVVDGALIVDLVPAETVESFKTRSVVMVPLLRGDRPVGMMLLDDTPAQISRVPLPLAELIGRQLILVIDHDRVIRVLRDPLAERNRLVKVALSFDSTLELHEVMRRIARESARAASADTAGIYLLAEHTRALHPFVGYRVPKS